MEEPVNNIPDQDPILNRIADLSPEKRAILVKKLRNRNENIRMNRPYPNLDYYPLSYAQERLWFLDKYIPENSLYIIPIGVRIFGKLNQELLKTSIYRVVERHEILRSIFILLENEPVQKVLHEIDVPLPIYNLSSLREDDRLDEAKMIAEMESCKPFKLDQGPLLRAAIIELSQDDHILVIAMHHIIADAWSLSNFVKELTTIYESLITGTKISLNPIQIQYSDYSIWQREWIQGDLLDTQLNYWTNQLKEISSFDYVPLDYPRPVTPKYSGKHIRFMINENLSARLRNIGLKTDATLFMVLLSAFNILLMRYSRQEDIIIGSPISNRNRPEFRDLIGLFINTLVIRTDTSLNPSFITLLSRVKQKALEAYANQDLPFEILVDALQPAREQFLSPFFRILFTVQNNPIQDFQTSGLFTNFIELETGSVKFDLTVTMFDNNEGIVGQLGFNSEIFDSQTINRLVKNFLFLLEETVDNPTSYISEYKVLTKEEQKILLESFVGIKVPISEQASVISIIHKNSLNDPNEIAIVDLEQGNNLNQISYIDLENKSNTFSERLISNGIKPNHIVAIYLERSIDFIIVVLGVMKTGAIFLPIDPLYPQDRIIHLIEHYKIDKFITNSGLKKKINLTNIPTENIFLYESIQNNLNIFSGEGSGDINELIDEPQRIAYIILTSGTSGLPKGVQISRLSLDNYIYAALEKFKIQKGDRLLQFSSLGFDTSLEEIFCSLCGGATLLLRNEDIHLSIQKFLEVCEIQKITILDLPTAYWNILVKYLKNNHEFLPQSIRLVIIGGEKALLERLADWNSLTDDPPNLINTYGPTEATIVTTWWDASDYNSISPNLLNNMPELPIGRPVPNAEVYIVDKNFNLLPIGAIGELFIGGVGVASGYLNSPELTQEKFVSNPFVEENKPLFKSGDLARWNLYGELEFKGRLDRQVKIRGYRVELEEIEKTFRSINGILDTIIVSNFDEVSLSNILIAYYLVEDGDVINVETIRSLLVEKLPEYMIPSFFQRVKEFPITPNGKLDYSLLPKPSEIVDVNESTYLPPKTELEKKIKKIWEEVLQFEHIGINNNFFEVGGDSLKAAVLINRLQKEIGEVIFTTLIFDSPTIAKLSNSLENLYPNEITKWLSKQPELKKNQLEEIQKGKQPRIDGYQLLKMKRLIASKNQSFILENYYLNSIHQKNKSAIFILSAPRSGSTLLRVMLAGNPQLFSPPELALLSFQSLRERKNRLSGRDRGWLEGVYRALMELLGCSLDQAINIMQKYEESDLSTSLFYRELQSLLGNRILVDKTTLYSFQKKNLIRAEYLFDQPKYIHLIRNPESVIHSYLSSHIDSEYGYGYPYSAREKAELFWLICNENICSFLSEIPAERKFFIRFEDFVNDPENWMKSISSFLDVTFDTDMLEPYQGLKMTDGVHPDSKMVGDPTFSNYTTIDPSVANKWNQKPLEGKINPYTRSLAKGFGYYQENNKNLVKNFNISFEPAPLPREWNSMRSQEFPLTFSQQRLWFLDQLQPGKPVYNIPIIVNISGQFNILAFERSINEVIRRHEILRTFFQIKNGVPVQIICTSLNLNIPVVDLSHLTEEIRETAAMQLANEDAKLSFNLSIPPLTRFTVLRLGMQEHLILATFHHIVFDSWSAEVLFRELSQLYEFFIWGGDTCGEPITLLPQIPIQVGDYAVWQRTKLNSNEFLKQLTYWKKQLSGVNSALSLPVDFARPRESSMKGGEHNFQIPANMLGKIKKICLEQNVTLFMALIGMFYVLLIRYCNQFDISIGTPIANRTRSEIEGLIGFFANTIVLRVDTNQKTTFINLLSKIREITLRAFDNQDLPFDYLVEELRPERRSLNTPFFQVMFALQPGFGEYHSVSGLNFSVIPTHNGTAKFDLTLVITEEPNMLKGTFEFSTDIFSSSTITQISRHFLNIIESVVANQNIEIARISLFTESEKLKLLGLEQISSRIKLSTSTSETLIEKFKVVVGRHREREAVRWRGEGVKYGEIDEKSNRIARWMRRGGMKEGDLVVMRVRKSIKMIEWILGIIKAGGAYVPIDLRYPKERQRQILEDVKEAMGERRVKVVTEEGESGRTEKGEWEEIEIERVEEEIERETGEGVESEVKREDLAYVIYTSGSTGKPKGVMVTHGNVVRLMERTESVYGFTEEDVWMLYHSYAFDFSVWEMWGALGYGGKLVVVGEEEAKDGEEMYRMIKREGVTVLNQTPSAFRGLMGEEERMEKRGEAGGMKLRYVIFGGEALEPRSLKGWYERHGEERVRLVNMYGITETTVHVTYRVMRAEDVEGGRGSVIGVPIEDLYVYVLDENQEPVPVGVAGEMYIGGEGVVRGYLNREELTKEKFIADPYREGGRLYRSGDIGRWRVEGELEYLGRGDQQVKIRGYRIELGEIEGVMMKQEGVREAVAIVGEGSGGEKRIEGYVVKEEGSKVKGEEVKERVRERLPEYMVPWRVVVVDKIPLTTNGKVDRKALEEKGEREKERGEKEEEGVGRIEEEVLKGIWGEVLKIGEVGLKEDFFEIGGHSLIAAQMMARVREEFGIEIGLRSVFERPTLEGLAERVREARQAAGKAMPKVEKRKEGERIPLSYGQERLWFLEKFQPGESVYHIPVVMKMKGEIEEKRLEKSLQEIVKRHEVLRSRIVEEGGKAEQVVEGEEWVEENVRMRVEEWKGEEEEKEEIEEEVRRPFDLERGPMVRSLLIKRGEKEGKLVVVMHHIVGDGWSMGVMVKEMGKIYRGEEMDEIELQYGDYAVWQREKMGGEVMEEGIRWWKEEMAGQKELNIPTDRERPEVASVKGGRVKLEIGEEEVRGLRKIGREEGATMYMVLKGGLDVLLYRYSGEEEVSVGTVVANRGEVGMEKLIGYFANTIVMRVRVEGREGYRELLRRVKEKALGAYAHGEVPFERVVSEIGVERNTSRTPLFGVMFVLQNVPMGKLELAGIEMEAEEVELGRVPFELSVVMEEREGKLEGVIEYNEGLYDRSTIERMARHYEEILKGVVKGNGEEAVGKMRLMSEREEKRILEEWNETRYPITEGKTIVDLFEEQVRRSPEAIAVIAEGERGEEKISYEDLDKKSNQLGRRLKKEGVKKGEIVGLEIERSVEMIIGIMGIMKAGGAYVPIEPSYPEERIGYILKDVEEAQGKSAIIVTTGGVREKAEMKVRGEVNVREVEGEKSEGIGEEIGENDLAYVIYTSGSTGKPKGVMIEHGNAVNLWEGLRKEIYGGKERRGWKVSLNAPLLFDASVQQWLMLLSGETIVIVPGEKRMDGEGMVKWIREKEIDVIDCVPTQLKLMEKAGIFEEGEGRRPKVVLPGGEAIDKEMWGKMVKVEGMEIYNMYGPTECTVDSTMSRVRGHEGGPSIGRGMANVRLYVMDGNGEIVPEGVGGELYIGGKGVGRGYLNRKEMTEERYVRSEYEKEGRLYRTGDRVRWKKGELEYLGRTDNQVKVRGYRIELGEVEAVLRQVEGVKEAVVMVREEGGREKQMVAYIEGEGELKANEIRGNLKKEIPEYMIPTEYIKVEKMPMTASGKIDRKSLEKEEGRMEWGWKYEEPRTEKEKKIARVWGEVLGVERVGVKENFFEMGGDSILTIQVVSKVKREGLKITPRQMFEAQTVEELAQVAEEEGEKEWEEEADQGEVEGEVPLTPIQRWFFEEEMEERWHWNQAMMMEVKGRLEGEKLKEAVKAVMRQHDGLRMRFRREETGEWKGRIEGMSGWEEVVEEVDLGGLTEEKRKEEMERRVEKAQRSLDLEKGPLVRVVYFDNGEDENGRLFVVIHHLVIDGVSWRILLEDLDNILEKLTDEKQVKLPSKTSSYKQWADKINQFAVSLVDDEEIKYWKSLPSWEELSFPADYPEGKNVENSSFSIKTSLSTKDTKYLLNETNMAFGTEIMEIFITALSMTFQEGVYSSGTLIDVESHGRNVEFPGIDITRTVGWFTNIYPVFIKVKPNQNLEENIKSVKEQMRKIPHNGNYYGFYKTLINENHFLKRPKISFNYLGQVDASIKNSKKLRLAPEKSGTSHSKIDLRRYWIDIILVVRDERLFIEWVSSSNLFNPDRIKKLADLFLVSLIKIISYCISPSHSGYTPSDFPNVLLTDNDIEFLVREIDPE